ncbi:MAG TPA: membrane protein insertase YidC, partial [Pyrinomonadaceae bacterium]|nr:membrane protein insertase YidC [Pyrinomonadaceae bacterium]
MENSNNTGNQSRFLIAAVLSMIVLFGWSYFYAPKKPAADDANSNTAAVNSSTPSNAQPQSTVAQVPAAPQQPATGTPDTTPNRTITIKAPLYEVKLDSRGAVVTSWIILRNKSPKEDKPVHGDGSTDANQKPLQLISEQALSQNPRQVPFRLSTDDANVNSLINDRNYQVSESSDVVEVADGGQKQIDFTLTDASGVEVTKSFVFRAENYIADVAVKLSKGGQPVPNTKLLIGASLGDQAIVHHSFYHPEPEAIAYVDDAIFRHQGPSFTFDQNNESTMPAPGNVDWAGVGDAYFAMAAVPSAQVQGLTYQASKYEFP